jgi:hypothetical protein
MGDAGAIACAVTMQAVNFSEPILKSGTSTPYSTLAFSCLAIVHCALDDNQNSKLFHHFLKW